jgi:succinate dehydrogenase/fumarate reductase flavoprotein subunit
MPADTTVDVLVAGSGAAGFTAAITARHAGLDVLMVEKDRVFGGTTAYSAGVVWLPCNEHARRAGKTDSREQALQYLAGAVGNRLDRAKAEAFVDNAAAMLAFLEVETHVRYQLMSDWADYDPDLPGGSQGGRSLLPEAFDGRRLGKRFAELRAPIPTMTILGGMMVNRDDFPHLFAMTKSARSAWHVARIVARHARDRLTHARGTRIGNGNALVARLALSAEEMGIPLRLSCPLVELLTEGERVVGAIVEQNGRRTAIGARRGVVLACGGFPADAAMRARLYGHVQAGAAHHSLPPAANTGDAIRLAEQVGGRLLTDVHQPAAWTPVSLVPQRGGGTIPFPHFIDRGKPGVIAVDHGGRRFTNEARSYHVFVPAMIEASRGRDKVACWLVADHRAVRAYGLGAAPPYPAPIGSFVASGYLKRADSLEALGAALGIDGAGLAATVAAFNGPAARGEDPAFGKGSDAYQRFNGWAAHRPNPCVAPIVEPPFYGLELVPGDIGTFAGLATDPAGRVLDGAGRPIGGLFAVGNDMASVMGGTYPGAGITLGPGMTFAWLAGRALAATPAMA